MSGREGGKKKPQKAPKKGSKEIDEDGVGFREEPQAEIHEKASKKGGGGSKKPGKK